MRQIESDELAPGSRLPSIVTLAQHYEVALTTVRKALDVLDGRIERMGDPLQLVSACLPDMLEGRGLLGWLGRVGEAEAGVAGCALTGRETPGADPCGHPR